MEKSVTTPDHYPLTLNALTSACNQKSSRNPVLTLEPGLVQRTARQLEDRHLINSKENFKSRVEKYTQRLCNTPFADFQFSEAEFAIICLLLLRGLQTPGELRTRGSRLHEFHHNHAVAETLQGLIDREGGPLVVCLPRKPGRQDSEYAHLFSGDVVATEAIETSYPSTRLVSEPDAMVELEARVVVLEQELSELGKTVRRLEDR